MHQVWCKNLCLYADKLSASLNTPKWQDPDRVISMIINTADYWSVIISQLAEEIKTKIEEISRSEVAVLLFAFICPQWITLERIRED